MKQESRNRVQVTLTVPMRMALEHLARRHGDTRSGMATTLLRQALDRTIQSKEVQDNYAQHLRGRTVAQWQEETTTNHAIETDHQANQAWLKELIGPGAVGASAPGEEK